MIVGPCGGIELDAVGLGIGVHDGRAHARVVQCVVVLVVVVINVGIHLQATIEESRFVADLEGMQRLGLVQVVR